MADNNTSNNFLQDGKSVGFDHELNNGKVFDTLPDVVPTTAEGYSIYSNLKDGKVSSLSHRSDAFTLRISPLPFCLSVL